MIAVKKSCLQSRRNCFDCTFSLIQCTDTKCYYYNAKPEEVVLNEDYDDAKIIHDFKSFEVKASESSEKLTFLNTIMGCDPEIVEGLDEDRIMELITCVISRRRIDLVKSFLPIIHDFIIYLARNEYELTEDNKHSLCQSVEWYRDVYIRTPKEPLSKLRYFVVLHTSSHNDEINADIVGLYVRREDAVKSGIYQGQHLYDTSLTNFEFVDEPLDCGCCRKIVNYTGKQRYKTVNSIIIQEKTVHN